MNGKMTEAHVVADQGAVLALLGDPKTHGLSCAPVRIDTHGAVIFLAGDNAYKLKRAVKFPFMDLSTVAKRKAACEQEILVNAVNAPSIYIGVVPVTRGTDSLEFAGQGEPVDWLVHMYRFDEKQTLDCISEKEGLPPPLLAKVVGAILASHARAPLRDGVLAAKSLRLYLEQNQKAFRESPELFSEERATRLTRQSEEMLTGCWELLLERGRGGYVRRCHGDLHLRNIVLLNGEPTLFDAVEFDDAIATGDVLYDLAFLLMDLWERGLKSEANLVLNRYLWGSDDEQIKGLAALPIFLSIRAAIRAKVIAATLPHLDAAVRPSAAIEAQQYFSAAEYFLQPYAPGLVAIGGLSGTGKTTLAAAIAPFIGRPPGAIHLRSDVERKMLAGVGEMDRLPQNAYTRQAAEVVYASLRRKAELALNAQYSVIVDAVYARTRERDSIAETAAQAGAPFTGLWLEGPTQKLVERVRARRDDASDATEDIVQRQSKYDTGPIFWHRMDATRETAELAKEALAAVGSQPGTRTPTRA